MVKKIALLQRVSEMIDKFVACPNSNRLSNIEPLRIKIFFGVTEEDFL